ncbi:MAG: phenylacetate--CoA ligase, partial [Chloroflexi bacterium]
MPIWNPQAETMSRDEMSQLQLQRLRQIAEYVQRVPFYKKAFAEKGVNPADIKSLEDLSKLPFTTKQ